MDIVNRVENIRTLSISPLRRASPLMHLLRRPYFWKRRMRVIFHMLSKSIGSAPVSCLDGGTEVADAVLEAHLFGRVLFFFVGKTVLFYSLVWKKCNGLSSCYPISAGRVRDNALKKSSLVGIQCTLQVFGSHNF